MENVIEEIQVSYNTNCRVKTKIENSNSVYELLLSQWNLNLIELQEEFKVLLLNRANDIIGIHNLSKGGNGGTIVDLKILFAVALKCNACSIIIAHNHPSGTLKASDKDIEVTKSIKKVGELMDICLLDHIIITKFGYYSFVDEGVL
ncbi:JAB domain-containing protein [Flavobacterium oreochromis]|uniref:JAB domain-containing protein n=1 Tax=Flavobacterium oreochromis TaxID=2906078 RepID=A0ABW8P922_9FLAO|nr:JAB domain-containing protein [Flavobacterium oreochromis]OWP78534.1 DNA repair protein [Flavobacterium oreochromis]